MALRLITLAGDPEAEARLATALGARPDLELVMRCVDRIEMLGCLRGGDLDAVVSIGLPVWLDAMAAEETRQRGVTLVGVTDDPLEADRLSLLGARLVGAEAPVDQILERCSPQAGERPPAEVRMTEPPESRKGRILAVWGPKGSPGRTTIAIELAHQLASGGEQVVLVDADAYGGDVVQALGIVEELPALVWAASAAARGMLTPGSFDALRRTCRRGPAILPGLARPDLWADVSEYGWEATLSTLRRRFDHVVCDLGFCLEPADAGPRGRNEITRIALRRAHRVVAVCRGDAVGVKNFLWSYGPLADLVDADDIVVVVNRVRAADAADVGALLKRHIGRRAVAFVPDDSRELQRARREGKALSEISPGSDVVAAITNLAASTGGRPAARGFLGRLAGRR